MEKGFIAKQFDCDGLVEDVKFETEKERDFWMKGFNSGCQEGRADESCAVSPEEYESDKAYYD